MSRGTDEELNALLHLFNACNGHSNSGALVIQRFLLSLYNGRRFPFDLTDLRRLDLANFEACLQVLRLDYMPQMEVHVWLATITGKRQGWFSLVFEDWAYAQRLPKRTTKADLEDLRKHVQAAAGATPC